MHQLQRILSALVFFYFLLVNPPIYTQTRSKDVFEMKKGTILRVGGGKKRPRLQETRLIFRPPSSPSMISRMPHELPRFTLGRARFASSRYTEYRCTALPSADFLHFTRASFVIRERAFHALPRSRVVSNKRTLKTDFFSSSQRLFCPPIVERRKETSGNFSNSQIMRGIDAPP